MQLFHDRDTEGKGDNKATVRLKERKRGKRVRETEGRTIVGKRDKERK